MGSLLARHLVRQGHSLRLMYHRTPLPPDLAASPQVQSVQADLSDPGTLPAAVDGIDVVVHFAGVLFAPRPERFLPETNTKWFANLLAAAIAAKASRVILASFPQVEGATSVKQPATGRLDRQPISAHAQTRLEEERHLFEATRATTTTPIVLRLGMVYGKGVLMIDAARWLARRRLLGVWKEPTLLQLVATADYVRAVEAAIVKPRVEGIYHVGDDYPVTLQQFLDEACRVWECPPPVRVPVWFVFVVATLCEAFAMVAGTRSPLTRDFVRLGRVPHWGDTRRAREELIPDLLHPRLNAELLRCE